MSRTLEQYKHQVTQCRALFTKKMVDYGTAWRILRLSSLVDQLYIKAKRIRTIEEKGNTKVADTVKDEYIGIVNYSVMAVIQLDLGSSEKESPAQEIQSRYDQILERTQSLMLAKNHDYGEAWRMMQQSSLTDLILMKILRVKRIMFNDGETLVSEGMDANFMDMINYALFAMIKIEEENVKEMVL